ncbi:MAG: polymorphic toxin type 23 domain-containing protein [bacterium]|nr:polymorphic toxin type 23 domain-containing protein [bacterium]
MRVIVILFFLGSFSVFGQNYFRDHFGGSIGLVMTVGSHNSNVGINLNGYYTDYFYQVNLGTRINFHPHSFGNRRNFWESRSTAGVVITGGKEEREVDFEMDGLNHQTEKNLGVGFNYVWYYDGAGTSQTSGGFGMHIREFSMYHENDIFGGQGRDRFRTGQFHFSYRYQRHKFTAGIQLWTGESKSAPLKTEECDDCKSGYRDLRDTKFGRTSHGIFYLGWRQQHDYQQNSGVRVGWDAERIRHIFQNKMIHDLGVFINRPTPHYPMLDENGLPIFDSSKVRKPRPYLSIGANSGWAY